jgi:hypothetical protein
MIEEHEPSFEYCPAASGMFEKHVLSQYRLMRLPA